MIPLCVADLHAPGEPPKRLGALKSRAFGVDEEGNVALTAPTPPQPLIRQLVRHEEQDTEHGR